MCIFTFPRVQLLRYKAKSAVFDWEFVVTLYLTSKQMFLFFIYLLQAESYLFNVLCGPYEYSCSLLCRNVDYRIFLRVTVLCDVASCSVVGMHCCCRGRTFLIFGTDLPKYTASYPRRLILIVTATRTKKLTIFVCSLSRLQSAYQLVVSKYCLSLAWHLPILFWQSASSSVNTDGHWTASN